ncbi:MAG TPA: hypothetical protein VKA08_03925 [Balneolales bacterium]|nr:hypothetical protein [Balneolales bacterium]
MATAKYDSRQIAKTIGVDTICVEYLMTGKATINISGELGVTKAALQDFIDGRVQESVSLIIGMPRHELQQLRDRLAREEAIALVLEQVLKKRKVA